METWYFYAHKKVELLTTPPPPYFLRFRFALEIIAKKHQMTEIAIRPIPPPFGIDLSRHKYHNTMRLLFEQREVLRFTDDRYKVAFWLY
jgi:hypothetical protein